MRGFAVLSLSLLIVVSVSGCSGARDGGAPMPGSSRSSDTASTAPASPAPAAEAGRFGSASDLAPASKQEAEFKPVSLDEAGNAQPGAEAVGRKIIRNAEITLEVEKPGEVQSRIGAIAEGLGGFVVTSEIAQYGGSPRVSITMRVPAERFAEAMEALRATGSQVLSEKMSGQDVTEEYIDLQARIRTKQALEAQFLEIMKQARSVSDALEVQRQISEVRGEIERLEGRRRFLENQSSLSTIKITLSAPTPVITTSGPTFGTHIQRAFGDAVDTASAIVIGFIRFLGVMTPVVVLIGIPGFLLVRFLWRRMRRRMAAAQT
jgi:hypothetical protein